MLPTLPTPIDLPAGRFTIIQINSDRMLQSFEACWAVAVGGMRKWNYFFRFYKWQQFNNITHTYTDTHAHKHTQTHVSESLLLTLFCQKRATARASQEADEDREKQYEMTNEMTTALVLIGLWNECMVLNSECTHNIDVNCEHLCMRTPCHFNHCTLYTVHCIFNTI